SIVISANNKDVQRFRLWRGIGCPERAEYTAAPSNPDALNAAARAPLRPVACVSHSQGLAVVQGDARAGGHRGGIRSQIHEHFIAVAVWRENHGELEGSRHLIWPIMSR